MIRSFWFILPIILGTCNPFDIVRCLPEWGCNCQNSHDGDLQLYCVTGNQSSFNVNIQPHEYIQVQCRNYPEWSESRLFNLLPKSDAKALYFRMCDLPTNTTLGEVAGKLGTENIVKLLFQSFGSLNDSLTRDHLKGFPKLERLILSSNGLTRLDSDVFADLPLMIWLDLRENNVRLTPGIFNNTPQLEVLELGNNMMDRIEPGIFDPLVKLQLLNLWMNRFTVLEPSTFDKLTSLRSLDMNSNDLTTLHEELFAKLENLEALSLYNNNFTTLPDGLLRRNGKLKSVNLYNNKRNMTLPKRFFANLTQLEIVKLKHNGLIALPENLFSGATSLKNVSLEGNYLVSLPKRIFEGLHQLLELELNSNRLVSLPDGIFMHTTNLVKLNLARNRLTTISRHLFSNLRSLRVLNMQQNQLQVIEDRSFSSLTNLRIAVFSDNQLTFTSSFEDEYGKKSPFYDCTALEELYLANNNISEIFGDWIISSLELRVLDLKYNKIPYISTEDMQFLSNNIKVDLSHNQIQHIYLSRAEEVARYQKLERDVIILVEDNPIVCDCNLYDFLRYLNGEMHPYVQNYFHIVPGNLTCHGPKWTNTVDVSKLKADSFVCLKPDRCPEHCLCWIKRKDSAYQVNCSYQNLTSVPRNIEPVPHHTLELNFTGNHLTSMPSLTELGLKNVSVSKLLLANNKITDISVNDLPPGIEVLELHDNSINKLRSDVLQHLYNSTSLMTLTLHGNPWMCDCDAKDFLNFIQTRPRINIPSLSMIECEEGKVPMIKMTVTDLCPTDTIIIVAASSAIAIVGLIIGVLVALYYRYQREIKVWLYAHELCLWLVTEDELDKDKLYDAFISYSHKDEEFVVNELVQKLESGPRPFKLCLHFRDWLAGEWIPTQIARSVEESRRTIVVLSPNFLESVWGRMEFRAAHCQALNEGRARVILILYGEIGPTDDLDPDLKAYLSMNTYVKWGDPWFWDKLRYALPHPPELTKNVMRRKIFERHRPCIQISGEKKELLYPVGVPGTPPATNTPPADTLKVFICDEKNENKKENSENISTSDSNAKLILASDELTKHNFINKIQCTTV